MTSLESIVLPLAESRALVEHGIVLETALWWAQNLPQPRWRVTTFPTRKSIPAPVLSELLEAIRAKVGDAEFHSYKVDMVVNIGERTWEIIGDYIEASRYHKTVERAPAITDLLAAAALLMEVSK